MTRRLPGKYSSRATNPLPIGHLSNKSTVCSPVSMSHMSQDLVRNHMKSHYQRVNSAKACVDTSAPRSLKLTIKERDRKRREALQRSNPTTPRPQSQQHKLNDTFRNDGQSNLYTTDERYKIQGPNNDSRHNISIDQNGYTQYERTSRDKAQPRSQTLHLTTTDTNPNISQLHELNERDFERQYTSTPRLENGHYNGSLDDAEASLRMSKLTFSYKEPPTTLRKTKKQPEEIIWTEEQKYLNFISEVTNDVLARGIFSNRVLLRVFESHIEKRKEELEEERMREMIDQLKEDLEIID